MMEVCLSNSLVSPKVQLGTFRLRGAALKASLAAALEAGYRGIDTAAVYRNHKTIAATLQEELPRLALTRTSIFLTSKLGSKDQGRARCQAALELAMEELGTDYLDLFLIHWPGVQGVDVTSHTNRQLREESWQVLEENYKAGRLRSIGVSNYTVEHLNQLLDTCTITPHVVQVEVHPRYQQRELVSLCQEKSIHVQAYSSLGQERASPLLSCPLVAGVASLLGKSPAQILLRWGLQKGYTVLPRSSNPDHVRENLQVSGWVVPEEQMEVLDSLGEEETKFAWDPTTVL